ncbi:MAG TPA: hypothetical protein VGQ42_06590 [Candidatus Dormibacteraeota bacterium]|jgi:hypothetical protein|nr:hypothetical protein [Candidatus Dormibacteraeota bacterium]
MARPLSCPVCRINLATGGTHCPRCGLRIAALERRPPREADADALAEIAPPPGILDAMRQGALGGMALVVAAAVIAFAVTRGDQYAAGFSNAAFFIGGSTMTLAVVLGGVRVRRLVGDLELMRSRARGGGVHSAPDHVRVGVATAAALPLAVAVALAFVAH